MKIAIPLGTFLTLWAVFWIILS